MAGSRSVGRGCVGRWSPAPRAVRVAPPSRVSWGAVRTSPRRKARRPSASTRRPASTASWAAASASDAGAPPVAEPGKAETGLELVAAHLRGADPAFARLMVRYEARIRGMCWRYVYDAALLDDLVQETFFSLLTSLHRVDEHFNVAA